jgi:hypothetical protein
MLSLSSPRWLGLFAASCCLSCSGGSGLNPVQGTVLYKDQPLKGAVVTFHPKGADDITAIRPVGLTKEDGTFTVTTGQNEGAPAGEYIVTFICSEVVGIKGDKQAFSTAPPETQDMFQGAFADRQTSSFKVEIKKGPNQLEPFQLK